MSDMMTLNSEKIAARRAEIARLEKLWLAAPKGVARMAAFDEWYEAGENLWEGDILPVFDGSGHAYDRCMSDEHMVTGRVFVVPSERIVGISWAWPVVVTAEEGSLHGASRDPRQWEGDDAEPEFAAAVAEAIALAVMLGYPLADWAATSA